MAAREAATAAPPLSAIKQELAESGGFLAASEPFQGKREARARQTSIANFHLYQSAQAPPLKPANN